MQSCSTSKLLEPPHDERVMMPTSKRRTPPIDGDSDKSASHRAQIEVAEGTAPKQTSARQRLDGLAHFRIHRTSIVFNSEEFHGIGGKADVVQGALRRDNGSVEQVVAVKKLRSHEDMNQRKLSNEFVHEVKMTAGLSHKNIVKLVGFVEDLEHGEAWIVLSWAPNGNVREFLAGRKWEIPERVSLIKDTFEGVKYLHTRQPPICHGDLKSFNILVSSSYRAIITDFGSARAITEPEVITLDKKHEQRAQRNPTTGQAGPQIHIDAVGNELTLTGPAWSLRWAPPEVLDGERPSLSTDIWASGWICWEVMTDKFPFHEVNLAGAIVLMVIRGEVPATREDAQLAQIISLCSLMKDCWAFDPKARPNISRCCSELQWIPSLPPSGWKVAGHRVPSIELLLRMGQMYFKQDDYEKATSLFQQALSLARSAGDQAAAAEGLMFLGDVYQLQPKYTQSKELYIQAQAIYARVGDSQGLANTLLRLGQVYRLESEYTQAQESFTQAQKIYAGVGNDQGLANTLVGLGHVYNVQSKYTDAEESYTRAQEIYARSGDNLGRANTLLGLGNAYRVQSKETQAEESYTRAQEIYTRVGNDLGRANVLRDLGHLRRNQGRNAEAMLHFTEAKDIFAQIGKTDTEESAARWFAVVAPTQISFTP